MSNSVPRRRGVCLVVSAPSGAGKSTIVDRLRGRAPDVQLSISATTRARRPGEREGVHYHFVTPAAFAALVAQDAMLEWATVFGNSYGTPRAPVEAALREGRDVVFDIDWQGHRLLRAALPDDVVGVYILPPSLAALDARLRGRGEDPEGEVARRMQAARTEIAHWTEFDHVVVNHALEDAVTIVHGILLAARSERTRQPGLSEFVAAL